MGWHLHNVSVILVVKDQSKLPLLHCIICVAAYVIELPTCKVEYTEYSHLFGLVLPLSMIVIFANI